MKERRGVLIRVMVDPGECVKCVCLSTTIADLSIESNRLLQLRPGFVFFSGLALNPTDSGKRVSCYSRLSRELTIRHTLAEEFQSGFFVALQVADPADVVLGNRR